MLKKFLLLKLDSHQKGRKEGLVVVARQGWCTHGLYQSRLM